MVEIPPTGIPLSSRTENDDVNDGDYVDESDDANDGDFVDEGLEDDDDEDEPDVGSQANSGRRGPDLHWDLCSSFATIEDFKSSDIFI